jgi:hypothetical protein
MLADSNTVEIKAKAPHELKPKEPCLILGEHQQESG